MRYFGCCDPPAHPQARRFGRDPGQLKEIPEIVEAHFITGSGNILVKLYCVDNEHLMRTIFDGILRIQGVASTETQISLQEAFQRQVNIDFIEE